MTTPPTVHAVFFQPGRFPGEVFPTTDTVCGSPIDLAAESRQVTCMWCRQLASLQGRVL